MFYTKYKSGRVIKSYSKYVLFEPIIYQFTDTFEVKYVKEDTTPSKEQMLLDMIIAEESEIDRTVYESYQDALSNFGTDSI